MVPGLKAKEAVSPPSCLTCSGPLKLHLRLSQSESRAGFSGQFPDMLPYGVLLLTPAGHVDRLNRAARELIDRADGLSITADGILAATSPEETRALRSAILKICSEEFEPSVGAGAGARGVRPCRGSGRVRNPTTPGGVLRRGPRWVRSRVPRARADGDAAIRAVVRSERRRARVLVPFASWGHREFAGLGGNSRDRRRLLPPWSL